MGEWTMPVSDPQRHNELDMLENFPGWAKATGFLENLIESRGCKSIADIAGGANPLLTDDFITKQQIDYCLIDISHAELAMAPAYYNKILADVTCPTEGFLRAIRGKTFALVFSHMLFEHIQNPIQAHINLYASLNAGGLAVHFFPSPNNLPLAINRLFPEYLTRALVRIAQPQRNISGRQGKFPAYYRMCGNPSKELHEQFGQIGYTVLRHTGFVGHNYYARFPIIRNIERTMRKVIVGAHIPLASFILLILEQSHHGRPRHC